MVDSSAHSVGCYGVLGVEFVNLPYDHVPGWQLKLVLLQWRILTQEKKIHNGTKTFPRYLSKMCKNGREEEEEDLLNIQLHEVHPLWSENQFW